MAKTYCSRTGGCNIRLATHLISLAAPHLPPPPAPLRILESASGPAVITTELLRSPPFTQHANLHINAVDVSEAFVANNKALIAANPAWGPGGRVHVETEVMDGMALQFPEGVFDASFTSLAIFAFPDPVVGASEMYRTLKAGGVAVVSSWKSVGWMPIFQAVEQIVRPGKEATRFPMLEEYYGKGKLEGVLRKGGFGNVEEGFWEGKSWWSGEEELVVSMFQSLKMMVGNAWTESEKDQMEEGIRRVVKEDGGELVARGEDGRMGVEMVAWTAVGRK